MQGRLKSITLQSSQEPWKLDFPENPARAQQGEDGQPQAAPHRIPISASNITAPSAAPSRANPKRRAELASSSEGILQDDDDDFMPPRKQNSRARASSSLLRTNIRKTFGAPMPIKPPKVRCAPSVFVSIIEYLNMRQRRIISEHGFGGLLDFCADGLDCCQLLSYLMDKFNPESMILEVGNEGGLKISENCVNKVLGLPNGHMDPPSSTEQECALALLDFKNSVDVEVNKDVKCTYLLHHLKRLNIDDALSVRIFFVLAFNKLLFPAIDNNIRGLDAFLTKDVSQFCNMNWCKAVVNELRHAAVTWRGEKKTSIPGCGIFLIIFYLDNLESSSSISHLRTPRARYFHKTVMENIIRDDKRRDRSGNDTYGNLQLKNISDTCYQHIVPDPNSAPAAQNDASIPIFPPVEQLSAVLNDIPSSSSRNKATDGLQLFASKASHAIDLIQSGSKMLVDARKDFICSIQSVLQTGSIEKTPIIHDTRDKDHCTNNQTGTNDDSSYSPFAAPDHEETIPFGSEVHPVSNAHAPIAREANVTPLHCEPCRDADMSRRDKEGHSPPCIVRADQLNSSEAVVNSTLVQNAPEIGTFAPEHIDKSIADIHKVQDIAVDSIANAHVHQVQELCQDKEGLSPPCIVPADQHKSFESIINSAAIQKTPEIGYPTSDSVDKNTEDINQFQEISADSICHDHLQQVQEVNEGEDGTGHDSSNNDLYDRTTLFAATQDNSGFHIRARPRIDRLVNIPTRYRSPFKCITPRPQIDMVKALAVRNKICTELKDKNRRPVLFDDSTRLTCTDVANSFADGGLLFQTFMCFYISCLVAEEKQVRPKCFGYRVFLSRSIGYLLNNEKRVPDPSYAALLQLQAQLDEVDILKVKLFFIPIPEDVYYSVYCLTMIDCRIDILDSSNDDHQEFHKVISDTVVPALNELFRIISNGKF